MFILHQKNTWAKPKICYKLLIKNAVSTVNFTRVRLAAGGQPPTAAGVANEKPETPQ